MNEFLKFAAKLLSGAILAAAGGKLVKNSLGNAKRMGGSGNNSAKA